jgi:type II secretory pathway pseudopilin PulG
MFRRRNDRTGFTIVELLVASAITLGIVVLLGVIFGTITRIAARANQRIDAFRDARAALQVIERDLTGLVRNQRDSTGAATTLPAAYFALKDMYSDPGSVSATANNQQLYALIALKNSGAGDVCSVGYYCRWSTSRNAYNLHRLFNDSTVTYTHLTVPGVITTGYASETDLYSPAASDDILASYIWDFRITAFDSSGAEINTYPYVCDQSKTASTALPAVIEVAFKAMSPEAARTVASVSTNPNDWLDSSTQNYQRLIAPNAYNFQTRIHLHQ